MRISDWSSDVCSSDLFFPDMLPAIMNKREELRYGENPHQKAALYLPAGPHSKGIAQASQVQGKALSYNNYNDADAALELVSEFRDSGPARSEEHTSELQSLMRISYAVFCLTKKKNNISQKDTHNTYT